MNENRRGTYTFVKVVAVPFRGELDCPGNTSMPRIVQVSNRLTGVS